VFCFWSALITGEAQVARDESVGTLQQLLAMPAPTPRSADVVEAKEKERPPEFYADDKVPPDNAPLEDLLDYWGRKSAGNNRNSSTPSEAVRQRLLAASEAEPDRLPSLLQFLPETEEAADDVKRLYDEAQSAARF